MVRLNITMPEDVVKDLRRVRNKSRYIAEVLREKFQIEKKMALERLLEESYKKAAKEDLHVAKEWEAAAGDGIE